jgi:hypothetical protein
MFSFRMQQLSNSECLAYQSSKNGSIGHTACVPEDQMGYGRLTSPELPVVSVPSFQLRSKDVCAGVAGLWLTVTVR